MKLISSKSISTLTILSTSLAYTLPTENANPAAPNSLSLDDLGDALGDLGDKVGDGIGNVVDDIGDKVDDGILGDLGDSLGEKLGDLGESLGETGKEWFEKAKDLTLDDVKNSGSSLLNNANDYFKDFNLDDFDFNFSELDFSKMTEDSVNFFQAQFVKMSDPDTWTKMKDHIKNIDWNLNNCKGMFKTAEAAGTMSLEDQLDYLKTQIGDHCGEEDGFSAGGDYDVAKLQIAGDSPKAETEGSDSAAGLSFQACLVALGLFFREL